MEDAPTRSPLGSPNKGGLVSILGTLPREDGSTPISGAIPGVPARLIMSNPGLAEELVAIVGPPSHEVDWQKPIAEYLQVGAILDDEIKTWCLACRVKGYLIHDNGLYQCGTVGILQWCIPLRRPRRCSLISMKGSTGITVPHGAWLGRPSNRVFTARSWPAMRRK
jgi:hypothetical protein